MTSSGLKRPIDHEQLHAGGHMSGISGGTPNTNGIQEVTGVNVAATSDRGAAGGGS